MIYNRPIYHCQCCGAVVIQYPYRMAPLCCGQVMVKAAEETLRDDLSRDWNFDSLLSDRQVGYVESRRNQSEQLVH